MYKRRYISIFGQNFNDLNRKIHKNTTVDYRRVKKCTFSSLSNIVVHHTLHWWTFNQTGSKMIPCLLYKLIKFN